MASRKTNAVSAEMLAAARRRAKQTRACLANKPASSELLTSEELADAAPFYFVLRAYVQQLKETRQVAGLTLADLAARTGLTVEYLSRLETGAQTNPTWKTLGVYAAAVGLRPRLTAEAL